MNWLCARVGFLSNFAICWHLFYVRDFARLPQSFLCSLSFSFSAWWLFIRIGWFLFCFVQWQELPVCVSTLAPHVYVCVLSTTSATARENEAFSDFRDYGRLQSVEPFIICILWANVFSCAWFDIPRLEMKFDFFFEWVVDAEGGWARRNVNLKGLEINNKDFTTLLFAHGTALNWSYQLLGWFLGWALAHDLVQFAVSDVTANAHYPTSPAVKQWNRPHQRGRCFDVNGLTGVISNYRLNILFFCLLFSTFVPCLFIICFALICFVLIFVLFGPAMLLSWFSYVMRRCNAANNKRLSFAAAILATEFRHRNSMVFVCYSFLFYFIFFYSASLFVIV